MFQKFVILTIVCTLIVCFEILPALMLHTQKKIIWQIAVFLLRHSTTTAWIHSSHTIPGKCFRQFSGTLCSRPTFHAVMQFTNKPFWRHRGYKFTRIRVPVQCANRIVTHGDELWVVLFTLCKMYDTLQYNYNGYCCASSCFLLRINIAFLYTKFWDLENAKSVLFLASSVIQLLSTFQKRLLRNQPQFCGNHICRFTTFRSAFSYLGKYFAHRLDCYLSTRWPLSERHAVAFGMNESGKTLTFSAIWPRKKLRRNSKRLTMDQIRSMCTSASGSTMYCKLIHCAHWLFEVCFNYRCIISDVFFVIYVFFSIKSPATMKKCLIFLVGMYKM